MDFLPEDERLISSAEFAARLGVSLSTFKRHRETASAGLPTPVRIGRCVRWRLSDVLAHIRDLGN